MMRFFSSDAPKEPDQHEESKNLITSLIEKHPTLRDELQLLSRTEIKNFLNELEIEISSQTSNPFTKARIKTGIYALKIEFSEIYELLSLTPSHMMILHMLIIDANAENESQIKTLHIAHRKIFTAIKKQVTIAVDPDNTNQAMLTYFYKRVSEIISLSVDPDNIRHQVYNNLRAAASRTQPIRHEMLESLRSYSEKCKEDITQGNGYLVKTYRETPINNFEDFYNAILSLKDENKEIASSYVFFDDDNLKVLRCHLDILSKIDLYISSQEKELLSKAVVAKHKLTFKAMPAEGETKKDTGPSISEFRDIVKACRFAQSRDIYESVINELNKPSLYTTLSMQGSASFTAIARAKLNWERRQSYASLNTTKIKKLAEILDGLTEYLSIMRECILRVDILTLAKSYYINKPQFYINTLKQLIDSTEKLIATERCKLSQAMLCRLEIKSMGHSDVVLATLEELQAVGIKKTYVENTKKLLPKAPALTDDESNFFKQYIGQYGSPAIQGTLQRLEEDHPLRLSPQNI